MATKKKTEKVEEVEAEEVEAEVELEELEADVNSDEKPTKKGKKSADDEVTFGAADLARLANEKFGTKLDARGVRTLLRKMAREDNPRIKREIVAGNRSRYNWSGPDDPEVKAVLKAIEGGELDQMKKEALDKLKSDKAAKKAKKEKAKKGKAKDED